MAENILLLRFYISCVYIKPINSREILTPQIIYFFLWFKFLFVNIKPNFNDLLFSLKKNSQDKL